MKTEKIESTCPIVKVRRVVKHGNSFYIFISKAFMRLHNLQKGEKVPVLCDHILKVVPMKEV